MDATAIVISVIGFLITVYSLFGIAFKIKTIDDRMDVLYERTRESNLAAIINQATTSTVNVQIELQRKRIEDCEILIHRYRNGIDNRINNLELKIKSLEMLLDLSESGNETFTDALERLKKDLAKIIKEDGFFSKNTRRENEIDFFDVIERYQAPPIYGYGGYVAESLWTQIPQIPTTPLLDTPQYQEVPNDVLLDLAINS